MRRWRWRCVCGVGGRIPNGVDALEEGYRRLMEHQKKHNERESDR